MKLRKLVSNKKDNNDNKDDPKNNENELSSYYEPLFFTPGKYNSIEDIRIYISKLKSINEKLLKIAGITKKRNDILLNMIYMGKNVEVKDDSHIMAVLRKKLHKIKSKTTDYTVMKRKIANTCFKLEEHAENDKKNPFTLIEILEDIFLSEACIRGRINYIRCINDVFPSDIRIDDNLVYSKLEKFLYTQTRVRKSEYSKYLSIFPLKYLGLLLSDCDISLFSSDIKEIFYYDLRSEDIINILEIREIVHNYDNKSDNYVSSTKQKIKCEFKFNNRSIKYSENAVDNNKFLSVEIALDSNDNGPLEQDLNLEENISHQNIEEEVTKEQEKMGDNDEFIYDEFEQMFVLLIDCYAKYFKLTTLIKNLRFIYIELAKILDPNSEIIKKMILENKISNSIISESIFSYRTKSEYFNMEKFIKEEFFNNNELLFYSHYKYLIEDWVIFYQKDDVDKLYDLDEKFLNLVMSNNHQKKQNRIIILKGLSYNIDPLYDENEMLLNEITNNHGLCDFNIFVESQKYFDKKLDDIALYKNILKKHKSINISTLSYFKFIYESIVSSDVNHELPSYIYDIISGKNINFKKVPDKDSICAICHEKLSIFATCIKLHCCHILHARCAHKWLYETPKCPVCKIEVIIEWI